MFKFFKRDPISKAKKHVEKAIEEFEEGYPDYACSEYEKAARLFKEADRPDFAVKYFREAAWAALDFDDHVKVAEMKLAAAGTLLTEARFDEAAVLYSEASDHLFKEKKIRQSMRANGLAVICYLGTRNFDTCVNITKKTDKRYKSIKAREGMMELAQLCVRVLCHGEEPTLKEIQKAISSAKPTEVESYLVNYVAESVKVAIQTEVELQWAGQKQYEVSAKTPIEFELKFSCPVPVSIVDYRYNLSNSLSFANDIALNAVNQTQESWLLVVNPVLSGDGKIGPFVLTLQGESVLVNKHSNAIEFRIGKAPSKLALDVSPQRVSADIGDEVVFDVMIQNTGDGPAGNITVRTELSDGLRISLGGTEKSIQFLGAGERMSFQVYIMAEDVGDQITTLKLIDTKTGEEVSKTVTVKVT
ncbi:MAG: hypothetical protein BAJATHORv1_30075 [Candidatus Thorarchaeota archaeon]|nr:MAG: hypothetical protein BAJATHORv1_30075 [Candidatus Thorarchaeota archaeon]